MQKLRWPLRVYLATVIAAGALGLVIADVPGEGNALVIGMLFVLATLAQLRTVHVSTKMKISVGDAVTFAASLLLAPFWAMGIAAASMLVSTVFVRSRASWYSRAFNAAVSALGTGAAAATFAFLAVDGRSIMSNPVAVVMAAVVMYFVQTALVDGIVALQLRRDPIATWWPLHRRDIAQHAALYGLGALGAFSVTIHPWAAALFVVPVALVLMSIRDAVRLREQTREAIYELADLVDRRDPYTHSHSQRVAVYAEKLARRLKLSQVQIDLVREAARMHDLGKISTPDNVLHKPGSLSADELVEMHAHAEDGAKLLARLPEFWEGAALVRAHHERADGSGYPRGLAGNEIPLEASVIAVSDSYDAMATDRPYRNALGWTQIRAEFLRCRGSQWRGDVVDAFIAMLEAEQLPAAPELRQAVTVVPAGQTVQAVAAKQEHIGGSTLDLEHIGFGGVGEAEGFRQAATPRA